MDFFRKVIQQKKALFQILIMKGYNKKKDPINGRRPVLSYRRV